MRRLRQKSKKSYGHMVHTAHCSKTTLSSADKGDRCPPWPVVRGYVTACGGDLAEFELLWRAADEESKAARTTRPAAPRPEPACVTDVPGYRQALRQIRESTGHTYRGLSQSARRRAIDLPRSTVYDLLNQTGNRMPRRDLVERFLLVCEVDPEDVARWLSIHDDLSVGRGRGAGDAASGPPNAPEAPPAGGQPPMPVRIVLAVAVVVVLVVLAVLLFDGGAMW
jgi:hypothetical protein